MIEQKKANTNKALKQKLATMSFNKKLLLVFMLSSFVTLAATSIAMTILILNFEQQDLNIATRGNKQFNQLSTSQVAQTLANFVMSSRDVATTLIYHLYLAHSYFSSKKDTYTSLQTTNPYLPPLSSSFNKSQLVPSLYFFSQNSTYYEDPFFDTILLAQNHTNYRFLRRINIIYYNTENPNDIMARTLPGTDDFIIKKPEDVASRFNGLQLQYVDRINTYPDAFSKKDNTTILIGVRSFVISKDNPKVKILIQMQLKNVGVVSFLQQVYYFSTTNILFIQPNSTTGKWFVSGAVKQVDFDITPIIQPGIRTVTLENGTQVIAATVGFFTHIPFNSLNTFTYSNYTIQRFVVITQTDQTEVPYKYMQNFIQKQNSAIFKIMVSWSLFIIVLCICMAITVGKNIFKPLKFVSEKIKCYIQSPKLKGNITQQLHSLPVKGVIKQLIKKIVQIIRKIQSSKKQIAQNKKIKVPTPLSICQREFQKTNGVRDYQVLKNVERQLENKYKQARKQ